MYAYRDKESSIYLDRSQEQHGIRKNANSS